jgi:ketosteroid isomerase-like protein
MRKAIAVLLLFVATAAFADAADEVRRTESAFAKAFADRDVVKFFSYVADDANFLGPKRVLTGKGEVVKVWSEYLKPQQPPFSWRPERVVTNAAGDIGLSTGPVFDAKGAHIADYSSIWQKQKDGLWKIIFDGPGAPVCPKSNE